MEITNVSEFLGANILDHKPFIVTPYLENGNVRVYIESNPDCSRLKIVRKWSHDKYVLDGQFYSNPSAVSRIAWSGISSFEEHRARRPQSGN